MSYDPGLPTARDRIRFTVGDTGSPELRPDTEYDALLSQNDERTATLRMAESLASQYAQDPSSISVAGMTISFSSLVSNWQQLASALRASLRENPATVTTLQVGRLTRLEQEPGAEYRRPMDWIPGDDNGDGW